MSLTSETVRDRAIGLIEFLTQLARVRSTIVRNINEYQSVLWMHEIPHDLKHCFTQAWGPQEEYDEDIWLEIKKYEEPNLPEVPDVCEEWVNEGTLYDTSDLPALRPAITRQIQELDPDADQSLPEHERVILINKNLLLEDFPEVLGAWDEFLNSKWLPWADDHQRWESVHNVYAKLFAIYQEQQKLGEEYELVLALGLLTWRAPSGYTVRRHLITAKAALSFEARLGKFTVTPAVDGAQLTAEFDMLDIADQPRNAKRIAQEGLQSANDNPWDRSAITPNLKALSNLFAKKGDGEYHDHIESVQDRAQEKPVVEWSPVLILRKRSLRGYEETLHAMSEQVSSGAEIPSLFVDLCEGDTDEADNTEDFHEARLERAQEIYFPKPYNEKQLEILQKMDRQKGVLVQGPPGTGKSHTIANLICHFLAIGKRVLVTAKTPRALQVLHDEHLPDDHRPLCISLLGSGIDERRSLEASVTGILTKRDQWNEARASEELKQSEDRLNELRSEKAELNYRIKTIRELETRPHTLDESYHGTAATIATRLRQESSQFDWVTDEVPYDEEFPLPADAIRELSGGLDLLTPEVTAELDQILPDPDEDLVSQEVFESLVNRENEAKDHISVHEATLHSQLGRTLEDAGLGEVRGLLEAVSRLDEAVESIRKRPMPWITRAVHDMLSDNDSPWKALLLMLSPRLRGLKERAQRIDAHTTSIPPTTDRKKLLQEARELRSHLDHGGNLGWWIFRPQVVRKNRHLVEDIEVDSHSCSTPQTLNTLIEKLSIEQDVDYCWNLWKGRAGRRPGPLFMQVAELEELAEALTDVVSLDARLKAAKHVCASIQGLSEPAWHLPDVIHTLLDTCKALDSQFSFKRVQAEIDQHATAIRIVARKSNAHPISTELLSALEDRSPEAYAHLLERIAHLRESVKKAKLTRRRLDTLSGSAPLLSKNITETAKDPLWIARLAQLEHAWKWAKARSWLKEFVNQEDLPTLVRRLEQIDQEIGLCTVNVSAILSWKFCFNRMQDSHRRHLEGWKQAMRRGGKFTGKYKQKHRRDAQRHLNACKDSVPAWVMPLHRVYETIQPTPGMFDVIIVDEASQCGPESLPLLYLAKQLLVVGDDQQISPEAVGIDREIVHRLMEDHLSGFEHADSFDVEGSLFDHCKRRFGNRIVLLEHFRCMPEIIRFSNDLCYHDTPLIPLRQYPPERLEPLQLSHVIGGYSDGSKNKTINRPEAETIADAVVQCCRDNRYDGRTMGVITLQGDAQAPLIENLLLDRLGDEEMEKRKLLVGKPYSFQGGERDIIFLSMVAARNQRIGTLTRATDQRRFNVAASRARDQMWLFCSVELEDLSQLCLRKRLLEFFVNPASQITKALGEEAETLRLLAHKANRQIEKPPRPFDSWFEVDVALRIASRGFRVVPQYPIAGKRIDLVVEGEKTRLAVECYGDHWHGPDQYEKDMDRQRQLMRSGLRFHIIRECEFNANPDETLERLWTELDYMHIHPVAASPVMQNDPVKTVRESETRESELSPESDTNARPNDIAGALAMKSSQLQAAIIAALKDRPNYSCVKDALSGFVLKHMGIRSRGKPRQQFSRKVSLSVKHLENDGVLKVYRSKNVRVKLISRET